MSIPELVAPGFTDTDVAQLRRRLRLELSAREAPRVLFLCVAIIVTFDVIFIAVAGVPPTGYLLSDVAQGVYALLAGIAIQRRWVPLAWVPSLFASAIVANNLALNYQFTLVGYSVVGVTLLLMASYGAITLVWRPFLISAALMVAVTGAVLISNDPVDGPAWTLTAATAIAVSATLLFGRGAGIHELARAQAEIQALAIRDPLTGLLNRRGLYQAAPVLARLAARRQEQLFAVFVDVTGLKQVNDLHGHDSGDRVIRATAAALTGQVRDADLVCRWGGDEMIVIGAGPPPVPADVARRLVAAVDTADLADAWAPAYWVGVASSDTHDIDALVARADAEMYARRRT